MKFIGELAWSELPDFYRMADVFVMPSTGEGFGIVFLEAAACGIPVVGGNRDGSLDALPAGKSRYAVDPDNSSELKSTLKMILGQPVRRNDYVRRFSYVHFLACVRRLNEAQISQAKEC